MAEQSGLAAPVVTVALDGENPWEGYPDGGAGFLGALIEEVANRPELQFNTPARLLADLDPPAGVPPKSDDEAFAVEFDTPPRAFSVLVFGQTGEETSAHYDDQAVLFAREELKPVRFTEAQIEADLVRQYRPGE